MNVVFNLIQLKNGCVAKGKITQADGSIALLISTVIFQPLITKMN